MNEKKLTTQETVDEKRNRQMAIIKASNQMLTEALKKALDTTSDPIRRNELEYKFNTAMKQNEDMAKTYLHASMDEVNKSDYREVDQYEVTKYNKRLEKLGITDEEIHMKEQATVTVNKDGNEAKNRRKRRGSKKDLGEDYVKLDNEEEFMKQTMVTDDLQIEENVERNKEYEKQMIKEGKSIVNKVLKPLQEEKNDKKINMDSTVQVERVDITTNTKEEENDNSPTIEDSEEEIEIAEVKTKKKSNKIEEPITYDFDFSGIPSYVQYDVIPLPSKGQCYPKNSPLRCGRIPVAYLTAADENIISSPNVYRDGKLFDIMLSRKILDKRINVNDIVSGDRDAIILWLRGTAYGDEFPISATNPKDGKRYNITIKLSEFDYNEFDLDSDENGLFDFNTSNGDLIKFKFFTPNDEEKFRRIVASQVGDINRYDIIKSLSKISNAVKRIELDDEESNNISEDIEEIRQIIGTDIIEDTEELYPNSITEHMIMHTVSVNGNEDPEYIRNYIENMRAQPAREYRNYFVKNNPGVDFTFTVNIPESAGGGSFETFLRIDDTIFINI